MGLGEWIGGLTPGRRADIIVVDLTGPHTQPVHDLVAILVLTSTSRESGSWATGCRRSSTGVTAGGFRSTTPDVSPWAQMRGRRHHARVTRRYTDTPSTCALTRGMTTDTEGEKSGVRDVTG